MKTKKSKKVKRKSAAKKTPTTDSLIRKINKWCREGENLTVQFKSTLSSLKGPDIVGMANAQGGSILLGVEEQVEKGVRKGKVVGVTNLEKIRRTVNNLCTSCFPPIRPRIQPVNHSKGIVVIVEIGKARSVTCSRGGTYVIRLTGGRQALDPERLKQRFFEQESAVFLNQFRSAQDDLRVLGKKMDNVEHLAADLKGSTQEARAVGDKLAAQLDQSAESLVDFRQLMLDELEEIKRRLHRIEVQM